MHITAENLTFAILALQALGTFSAIVYGVLRIERRFTRLEINLTWLKHQCPNYPKD